MRISLCDVHDPAALARPAMAVVAAGSAERQGGVSPLGGPIHGLHDVSDRPTDRVDQPAEVKKTFLHENLVS